MNTTIIDARLNAAQSNGEYPRVIGSLVSKDGGTYNLADVTFWVQGGTAIVVDSLTIDDESWTIG